MGSYVTLGVGDPVSNRANRSRYLRVMAAEVTERGNTFQVGQVRPLFGPAQINRGYLYDVSADGQKFLLAVQPEQTTSGPLTLVENWSAGLKK